MGLITRAQDNFNRADSTDLGANWDSGYTGQTNLQIVSNRVRSTSTTLDALETYNAVTLATNQWAQITLPTLQPNAQVFPRVLLRFADPPTKSGYEFMAGRQSPFSRIGRWSAGSLTALAVGTVDVWQAGDILRAEIRGNVLLLFRNGGDAPVLVAVDSTFTSGKAGLITFADVLANSEMDDFFAGDIVRDRVYDDFPKHKHREAVLRGEI